MYIVGTEHLKMIKAINFSAVLVVMLTVWIAEGNCTNFTWTVFGSNANNGIPAAFGDFNSDELTDVFVLKDNFRTIQIMLGAETEPLLRPGPKCEFQNFFITSVVPGDFDGDAVMDVLFTVRLPNGESDDLGVYINYGSSDSMNCTDDHDTPLFTTKGEPVALDYDKNMVIDMFGMDKNFMRTFWLFNKERRPPSPIHAPGFNTTFKLPHSHAYLDINNDFTADLFIRGEEGFEVWYGTEFDDGFQFNRTIKFPENVEVFGQSLFLDVELKDTLNHIIPCCYDKECKSSSILIFTDKYLSLKINFKDEDNEQWGFVRPLPQSLFTNAITLRGGDYNMDGYPDLLATLQKSNGDVQTFLLENIPCDNSCSDSLTRTFVIRWKALLPFSKNTVMGAFYDFYQDGILDLIMVEKLQKDSYRTVAFRNALDYDANFVKVIVLPGISNNHISPQTTSLGKNKLTYGSNLPGPRIAYYTTTQDGYPQHGTSAQIPQSAYFALQLPYTIFGLGRTPNFVDTITVGVANRSRTWTQLIPNSQMIVIPYPLKDSSRWKAQLFVTPSKLIVMSTIALGGTCFAIMLIIVGLYIKEKREDRLEKLQEAHRFHFDAM